LPRESSVWKKRALRVLKYKANNMENVEVTLGNLLQVKHIRMEHELGKE
jgi:hypothetical protein